MGHAGVVLLYAMWLAHVLLFRGEELADWFGLLVVVQNIFTSLFNSHLFDFHEGWMYVLGVGVAGGMVLRDRSAGGRRTVRNVRPDRCMSAAVDYQRARSLRIPRFSSAGHCNDAAFATDPSQLPDRNA